MCNALDSLALLAHGAAIAWRRRSKNKSPGLDYRTNWRNIDPEDLRRKRDSCSHRRNQGPKAERTGTSKDADEFHGIDSRAQDFGRWRPGRAGKSGRQVDHFF